jgi:glycosyltransferase involved in cell wall biosynthesis
MIKHPIISIVSPVYRAENIVDELVHRITAEVLKIHVDYEIVLVEDGSPDNSWKKIEAICLRDEKVTGIKLSRNYGQHYAITAGLEAARGEFVVVMDCDLQDDPKYIVNLYNEVMKGYDLVYGMQSRREHGLFKNITSHFFYFILNLLTEKRTIGANGNIGAYSILSRRVVNAFLQMREYHRHYLAILGLLGFNAGFIQIAQQKRFEGSSSYTLNKLFKLAVDGVVSQSDKLLRLSILVGFICFCLSFLGGLAYVISYFIQGSLPGYTSLITMLFFSTGVILMSIGVQGLYIGRIFDQVKNRPLYFIDKKINGD